MEENDAEEGEDLYDIHNPIVQIKTEDGDDEDDDDGDGDDDEDDDEGQEDEDYSEGVM